MGAPNVLISRPDVICLNKNAIRVLPEMIDFSPVQYFQFLAGGQMISKDDHAILWKLKRRIEHSIASGRISQEKFDQIRLIVQSKIESNFHNSDVLLKEWLNLEATRLKKSPEEASELTEELLQEKYKVDPIRVFEKIMEYTQGTIVERYFAFEWIPNRLNDIKKDIGNRVLDQLMVSNRQVFREYGIKLIQEKQDKNADPFLRALQGIVKQGGNPGPWLKSVNRSQAQLEEKAIYLEFHPELKSSLTEEEWGVIHLAQRKHSFRWLFKELSKNSATGVLTDQVKSEAFLFHAFEFPSKGLRTYYRGEHDSTQKIRSGEPRYEVTFTRPFAIQVTPVTQLQWALVMAKEPKNEFYPNRPVDSVSWSDVMRFIKKLNALDPDYEYRLPTEAEWEFAARGHEEGDALYSFADRMDHLNHYGWFRYNSGNHTHDVAELNPNSYGLYDTLGNVAE